MKRIILIFALLFLYSFLYANIPTATLLLQENPNTKETTVTNLFDQSISVTSGLQLFVGDILNTGTEEIILLIPFTTTIITLQPNTIVKFDIIELGGREHVVQITLEYGLAHVVTHDRRDIVQVLPKVVPPVTVQREDNKQNTATDVHRVYVQVINVNGQVTTKNTDIDTDTFVTKPDVDVRALIQSLRRNQLDNSILKDILQVPTRKAPIHINQSLAFTAYFHNVNQKHLLEGNYQISIEQEKFQTTLQLPLFFIRDNLLYNPMGARELSFGIKIWTK